MAILDQYGRQFIYKAARAAQLTFDRPYEPVTKQDIDKLIPDCDRTTLRSHSQRIYLNLGAIKGAIDQRGMYAVGRAWSPVYRGGDAEWGKVATEWLSDIFYTIGDVRGGMHDFKTNLFTWTTSIDVEGEVFILLTESKTGFAQYQGIPAHRIGNPRGINNGNQRGGKLVDGIVYYASGAPKEYAFLDEDGNLSEWIPAQNIIHLFDPAWQHQRRGIPGLTHCINDCRDIIQSTEWERLTMLHMSSMTMVEHNDQGGPDPDDNFSHLTGDNTNPNSGKGASVQYLEGGTVRFFKSGSGGKIEQIKNDRPGNPFLEFHDRLLKSAFAGLNWPFAFYSGHGIGGGTAQRTEIAAAQRVVEDRQDLLMYAAKRLIGYAIAKAQKRGDIPANAEWWKWDFTMPPKLTIDDGRITKELETLWKMGGVNLHDIVSMRGKTLEDHYLERAREVAKRKTIAAQVAAETGVQIEDREMSMLTANDMGQQTNNQPTDDNEDDNA